MGKKCKALDKMNKQTTDKTKTNKKLWFTSWLSHKTPLWPWANWQRQKCDCPVQPSVYHRSLLLPALPPNNIWIVALGKLRSYLTLRWKKNWKSKIKKMPTVWSILLAVRAYGLLLLWINLTSSREPELPSPGLGSTFQYLSDTQVKWGWSLSFCTMFYLSCPCTP